MKRFWLRRGLSFLGFAIIFVGLTGLAVMALWNALLPAILGVSTITFWQALGLLLLSRILFGGYRGYGPRGNGFRGYGWGSYGGQKLKQKMAERWQQMTPEQRERMKAQWRERCGGRGRWGGSQPGQPDQDQPTTTAI